MIFHRSRIKHNQSTNKIQNCRTDRNDSMKCICVIMLLFQSTQTTSGGDVTAVQADTVKIMSKPPAPSNGCPIYSFFGPAMWTRWMAGTVYNKSGGCQDKSRSDNHTQRSLDLRYLPQTNTR